ncbi:MAG: type II toxin-antitoxin system HicB family antitoxin [Acidobacteria bacterium]|nr:type II toxin-antitoxin system HicB family antitoxin [Acidobacteriota bacterium]
MFRCEVILYWSNEDNVFIADVPELPGCMAHGETQQEALCNINDPMGLWVDTARERGWGVPEPHGERLMLA